MAIDFEVDPASYEAALDEFTQAVDRSVVTVIQAVALPSDARLIRCRAALDSLQGYRERLNRLVFLVRATADHWAARLDDAMLQVSGEAVMGDTGDERLARRRLRILGVVQRERSYNLLRRRVEGFARDFRDAQAFIDGHRVEAITLLRASVHISADEYHSTSETLSPGIPLTTSSSSLISEGDS